MNILIAPNNYYVMPGIVMLESLFENNKSEDINIYIIQSDLTKENCYKLENFIEKKGGKCYFLNIPNTLFSDAPTSIHITKETYYRLLAQELLPIDLEKILYLDLDLVVTGSLKSLYDDDFFGNNQENFFVVCEGPGVSKKEWNVYDCLGIPYKYRYFNAGVLLMNLSLLRKKFDPKNIFDFISEHSEHLKYHDQDTLNALFYDKVKYANWHEYNQTILHIQTNQEAKDRLKTSKIIHYAGSDKPWNFDYKSWYFNLFWEYARHAGYKKMYFNIILKRFKWHISNHVSRKKD